MKVLTYWKGFVMENGIFYFFAVVRNKNDDEFFSSSSSLLFFLCFINKIILCVCVIHLNGMWVKSKMKCRLQRLINIWLMCR